MLRSLILLKNLLRFFFLIEISDESESKPEKVKKKKMKMKKKKKKKLKRKYREERKDELRYDEKIEIRSAEQKRGR